MDQQKKGIQKNHPIMPRDSEEHAVDMSHLTSRSRSGILLLEEEDDLMTKCCIFRIPGMLKMENEQAYTPYRFSIGPWHYGKTQLKSIGQDFKEAFLDRLIFRFPNPAAKMKELEEAIKEARSKAIECYEGEDVYDLEDIFEGDQNIQGVFDAANEKFDKILLLDGCFIIEYFRKVAGEVAILENENVLFSKAMILVIYHDLFLLENQIPWFILELLFEGTRGVSESNKTLFGLAMEFLAPVFSPDELKIPKEHIYRGLKIVHLVDLARRCLGYSSEEGVDDPQLQRRNTIPSATRLREAGVKFKKVESGNILDVTFKKDKGVLDVTFKKDKGVLEIPSLLINPSTEIIFRNVISFEQCSPFCIPRVTCYAMLLDCLVDTSDDLDLMSEAGIFCNRLNPDEAAKFLNKMRNGTYINPFFYAQLCDDVNAYCLRWWPKWRASLIRNYLTKPWAIVSVIFAIIVLLFTIISAFYK